MQESVVMLLLQLPKLLQASACYSVAACTLGRLPHAYLKSAVVQLVTVYVATAYGIIRALSLLSLRSRSRLQPHRHRRDAYSASAMQQVSDVLNPIPLAVHGVMTQIKVP